MESAHQNDINYLSEYLERIEKELKQIEKEAVDKIAQQLHNIDQSG